MDVNRLIFGISLADFVMIAIVAVGAARGAYRGIIREVLSLTGFIVGIILANQYHNSFGNWLSNNLSGIFGGLRVITVAQAIAFVIVVLLAVAAANFAGELLHKFLGIGLPGCLDRLGGFVIGFVEVIVFLDVALLALGGINPTMLADLLDHSALTASIWSYAPGLFAMLPKDWLQKLGTR